MNAGRRLHTQNFTGLWGKPPSCSGKTKAINHFRSHLCTHTHGTHHTLWNRCSPRLPPPLLVCAVFDVKEKLYSCFSPGTDQSCSDMCNLRLWLRWLQWLPWRESESGPRSENTTNATLPRSSRTRCATWDSDSRGESTTSGGESGRKTATRFCRRCSGRGSTSTVSASSWRNSYPFLQTVQRWKVDIHCYESSWRNSYPFQRTVQGRRSAFTVNGSSWRNPYPFL